VACLLLSGNGPDLSHNAKVREFAIFGHGVDWPKARQAKAKPETAVGSAILPLISSTPFKPVY